MLHPKVKAATGVGAGGWAPAREGRGGEPESLASCLSPGPGAQKSLHRGEPESERELSGVWGFLRSRRFGFFGFFFSSPLPGSPFSKHAAVQGGGWGEDAQGEERGADRGG